VFVAMLLSSLKPQKVKESRAALYLALNRELQKRNSAKNRKQCTWQTLEQQLTASWNPHLLPSETGTSHRVAFASVAQDIRCNPQLEASPAVTTRRPWPIIMQGLVRNNSAAPICHSTGMTPTPACLAFSLVRL
jgi:hypothetical protein